VVNDCTVIGAPAQSADGTFTPSGLRTGGKVTEVDIDDATWTALPPTALAGRNAVRIQNRTGFEIKTNYDSFAVLPAGYVGMVISDKGEAYYDITDAIPIYAKAASGAGTITLFIEEVS
jgi:hypothetical protein